MAGLDILAEVCECFDRLEAGLSRRKQHELAPIHEHGVQAANHLVRYMPDNCVGTDPVVFEWDWPTKWEPEPEPRFVVRHGIGTVEVANRADGEVFVDVPSLARASAIADLLNRGLLDDACRQAGHPAPEDVIRNG